MSYDSKPTYNGKVTLGANTVLGMGTWSHSGFTVDMIEDVEFDDDYDDFSYGLIHCGTVSFNGNFKADNTQGQDVLRSAMLARSNIGDIRFYIDDSSYWIPNNTTAAGSGGIPAESPIAHAKVQSIDVNFDQGANHGQISFTVQICAGPLRLI